MTTGMRGRGSLRGPRGGPGRGFAGRGRGQKPLPLMARPMPPPFAMRRPLMPPHGPSQYDSSWGMEPRFPGPRGGGRGFPYSRGRMRGASGQRGFGMRPPFGRMPRGRGGLLPPPMSGPMGPGMFRPGPPRLMGPPGMMRGRGMAPRGFDSRYSKVNRGKPQKLKASTSPTGEMNKPWVTEAMKNEILKKHKLSQKAKKARTKEDWEIFKEHRNKVTTMLREAKLEYIGAHPEEDVDKILAEASVSEGSETDPTILEKLMDEGAETRAESPTVDPEVVDMAPHLTEQN